MARIYARNSKGRTPVLISPVRTTRSHAMQDTSLDGFLEKPGRAPQTSRSKPARPSNTRRRLSTPAAHNADSAAQEDASGDDADNDEDSEDEADDEDNGGKPDAFAPSDARRVHQTGRKFSPLLYKNDFFADSDGDDDDIYEAVNNISDSDDGVHEESEEQIEAFDEQDIVQEFLNDADGLSVVGYGADIDPLESLTAFSEESSSSTDAIVQRRVRFTNDVEQRSIVFTGTLSPLLTRALLPSALPDDDDVLTNIQMSQFSTVGAGRYPFHRRSSAPPQQHGAYDEDWDSDATDEYLPSEAHTTPSALHHSPVEPALQRPSSSKSSRSKSSTRHRGPRMGTFQVDRDKSWGLYDPESDKIVILAAPETGRHDWLEKRYQGSEDSASETPEASLSQVLEDIPDSEESSQEVPGPVDVMLSGLTSTKNVDGDFGQTTGSIHAFLPPHMYQTAGDYLVGPEGLDGSDLDDEGDQHMIMNDFISFDSDDESDGDESPTSPAIYMPPASELFGNRSVHEQFPHLNNRNVTAFRQSTQSTHISNRPSSLPSIELDRQVLQGTESSTPSRKRKAGPFKDKPYDGVTPTSRILHMPKRRKSTKE